MPPKTLPKFISISLLVLAGYLANLPIDYHKSITTRTYRRLLTSYDVTPATFLPYELLTHKTLSFSQTTVDAMKRVQENDMPSVLLINDRYVSAYPVLAGLLAVPIYVIPINLNKIPALYFVEDLVKPLVLGRVAASFYTAVSVGIFFLILEELKKIKGFSNSAWDFLYLIFYAFGTNAYAVSSRALWQHTSSLLFISLSVLFMLKSKTNSNYVKLLGATCALAVLARPTNIVLMLVVTAFVGFNHKKLLLPFFVAALPFAVFSISYNIHYFGQPITSEYLIKGDTSFSTPLLTGLLGNLVSPARSLLVISPPLVASYVGIVKLLKRKRTNAFDIAFLYLGTAYCLILIMYSKWWSWFGADRFGYGFFTEWLPVLGALAYVELKPLKKAAKYGILLLIVWSFYAQFNAVWFRKSRCSGPDHNWTFYCLKPQMFTHQEY